MSARTYALRTTEPDRWSALLERCGRHDVYHTAAYHRLTEEHLGGQAIVFACQTAGTIVAMPMVLRQIAGPPGIGPGRLDLPEDARLCDVTSVHGYAGPVSSTPHPSQAAIESFGHHLLDSYREQGVVCAFSRLHPLIDGQEARKSVEVILAIYKSAESGRAITLPLKADPILKARKRDEH